MNALTTALSFLFPVRSIPKNEALDSSSMAIAVSDQFEQDQLEQDQLEQEQNQLEQDQLEQEQSGQEQSQPEREQAEQDQAEQEQDQSDRERDQAELDQDKIDQTEQDQAEQQGQSGQDQSTQDQGTTTTDDDSWFYVDVEGLGPEVCYASEPDKCVTNGGSPVHVHPFDIDVGFTPGTIDIAVIGEVLNPISALIQGLTYLVFMLYKITVIISATITTVVFDFSWVRPFATPIIEFEGQLQEMLAEANLYLVMLVITAFIVGIWFLRGRWAQGIFELVVSLFIVNLAIASLGSSSNEVDSDVKGFTPMGIMVNQSRMEGERKVTTTDWDCFEKHLQEPYGLILLADGKVPSECVEHETITPSGPPGLLDSSRDISLGILADFRDLNYSGSGNDLYYPQSKGGEKYSPGAEIVNQYIATPAQLVNFQKAVPKECRFFYNLMLYEIENNKTRFDYYQVLKELGPPKGQAEKTAYNRVISFYTPGTSYQLTLDPRLSWLDDPRYDSARSYLEKQGVFVSGAPFGGQEIPADVAAKFSKRFPGLLAAPLLKDDPDIREVVGRCEHDFHDYYKSEGDEANLGIAAAFMFVGATFNIFTVLFAGFVLMAALTAFFQAIRLLLSLLLAILPRGGKSSLWQTLAAAATSLIFFIWVFVFFGIYLQLMGGMLHVEPGTEAWDVIIQLIIMVIFGVAFIILLFKSRNSIMSDMKDRLSDWAGNIGPSGGDGGQGFGGAAAGGALGGAAGAMGAMALFDRASGANQNRMNTQQFKWAKEDRRRAAGVLPTGGGGGAPGGGGAGGKAVGAMGGLRRKIAAPFKATAGRFKAGWKSFKNPPKGAWNKAKWLGRGVRKGVAAPARRIIGTTKFVGKTAKLGMKTAKFAGKAAVGAAKHGALTYLTGGAWALLKTPGAIEAAGNTFKSGKEGFKQWAQGGAGAEGGGPAEAPAGGGDSDVQDRDKKRRQDPDVPESEASQIERQRVEARREQLKEQQQQLREQSKKLEHAIRYERDPAKRRLLEQQRWGVQHNESFVAKDLHKGFLYLQNKEIPLGDSNRI